MKLNLFLLGLAAADNKATVQRVGSEIAIADAEYTPKVTCDVTNNEFRVEVPAWRLGEMKMGLDIATASCEATDESDKGLVFKYKFDECGTRLLKEADKFVYENHIGRGPLQVNQVLRDLGMSYNIRCVIDRTGHVDNRFVNETTGEVGGEILPIYMMPDDIYTRGEAEGFDDYIFRMNIYHTEAYQQKYKMPQFPLQMQFKQDVYVGVEVITKMEHQYIFTTQCWASPTADTNRASSLYPLIDMGCNADEYTALEPRTALEDRFKSQTLRFPDSSVVYIHCDVVVCDMNIPNDPECQSTCRNTKAAQSYNRKRRAVYEKPRSLVTVGPIQVRQSSSDFDSSSAASTIASWSIAGTAFAAMAAFYGFSQRKKSQIAGSVELK